MIQRVSSLLRKSVPDVHAEGLLAASGKTVPADGSAGFQTGCVFQHVDGGANDALYVNEGTFASSAFKLVGTLTAGAQGMLDVTAGTVTASKAVVVDANKDVSSFRNIVVAKVTEAQGAPAVITDGDTQMTVANLQAKILQMTSTTGGRAPKVPTGTDVAAAVAVGNCVDWTFQNLGDQTVTITAHTGHTVEGNMALALNTTGRFRTRVSAANTAITYRLA
jgi:hypothetical protein